jgi:hypothetical protein
VDYGGAPVRWSWRVMRGPALHDLDKMSLHQAGMNDVLASSRCSGTARAFSLIGVQPVELADYGGSLTRRA